MCTCVCVGRPGFSQVPPTRLIPVRSRTCTIRLQPHQRSAESEHTANKGLESRMHRDRIITPFSSAFVYSLTFNLMKNVNHFSANLRLLLLFCFKFRKCEPAHSIAEFALPIEKRREAVVASAYQGVGTRFSLQRERERESPSATALEEYSESRRLHSLLYLVRMDQ